MTRMIPVDMAVNRIIDSIWTLEYALFNDTIYIFYHGRDKQEGYNREAELPKFTLIESNDDTRTVVSAIIDGTKYVVLNPQHVFSYTP